MGFLFWKKKPKDAAAAAEVEPPAVQAPVVEAPVDDSPIVDAPSPKTPARAKVKRFLSATKPETPAEAKPVEPVAVAEVKPVEPVAVAVEKPEVLEVSQAPAAAAAGNVETVELPKRSFIKGIKSLFSRIKFDVENLDALEDVLIQADFGLDASEKIVAAVKERAKKTGASTEVQLKTILADIIAENLERSDKALNLESGKLPYVILVVGVNGVGKTTTIGKLANWLSEINSNVIIAAADTFRAAAVEQIATWASRAGAQLVRPSIEGQDPASVAFEATELAVRQQADVLIIDTAGRLQNKVDLMNELDKIRRVIEKQATIAEVLLVIDATTGQNGMAQAKAFAEVAGVTGVALTKLDGTAKGGIVYSIQTQLGIPVKLVGVGEGIKDFAFFDAAEFAKGLVD